MKKLFYCLLCFSLFFVATSCGDDDDDSGRDDKTENNDNNTDSIVDTKTSVSLTYVMSCDSDLVAFVTPEIIYTDLTGTHSIALDEKTWSPQIIAYCYKTENGITTYAGMELDKDGKVPEPWIIDSYITYYLWKQDVHLNKVGIINDCILKFNRRTNYVIDSNKQYKLSYSFKCTGGTSSMIVDGKIVENIFSGTTLGSNGKSSWYADEVGPYIDELCSKLFTISIKIDSDGKISQAS